VTLVQALLVPLAVVAVVTPFVARSARRLGWVDVPSARSTHAEPVPRVGGIALLLGLAAGLAWFALTDRQVLEVDVRWAPYVFPLILYFLIGLADDLARLRPWVKFLAQAAAAALAVASGLRWDGAALGPFGALTFGPATPFMTWLWLVAVVTLVNFVDGIDLITCAVVVVVLAAAAGGGAGPADGLLYAIAVGAAVGLVVWNVSPAHVFPGDAATHVLGFLVATVACGVPGSGGSEPTWMTHGLPWVAASAPLLPGVIDVAMGLFGKARRGVPLVEAHSDHLYQRLTKIGRSHVRVALRYGVLAFLALLMVTQVAPAWGLGACIGLSALVLLWHLGGGLSATRKVPWGARTNAE
jgi:UDP-GlcNAc:undecaprenyl-phosphate GlcNAc-1-phosphate transferase